MSHSTHAGECSRSNELGRQLLVVQPVEAISQRDRETFPVGDRSTGLLAICR